MFMLYLKMQAEIIVGGNDFPCFEKQLVNTCGASITKLLMLLNRFKWTL